MSTLTRTPEAELRRQKRRRRLGKVARYALLTFLAIVILFPIYITIVNSLLIPADITRRPPKFFPTDPQWSSYADAWNQGNMATYMRNSFIVTIICIRAEQLIHSTRLPDN
ncbi:MAG: hypothetical protein U0W40_15110, partial [Acidimicrobiia bacterium]